MKTKNLIIALGVATSILATASVFADIASTESEQTSVQSGSTSVDGSWSMRKPWPIFQLLWHFIKSDLTQEDKTAIDSILKTNKDSRLQLEVPTWTGSEDTRKANMEAKKLLDEKLVTELTPYIIPEKLEQFKVAIVNPPRWPKWPKGPQDQMGPKWPQAPWMIGQPRLLPESINASIDKKLSTFSTNDEKLSWLNNIVTKIDAILTKLKWMRAKAQLVEFKDLLNDRIDEISWVSTNSASTIDTLLSE